MKTDKTTIGLSIVLAAVVALAVFSASSPVLGDHSALQEVNVVKSVTAVEIRNQTCQVEVAGWNFSGAAGAIDVAPVNNLGEQQNENNINEAVATLYNNDTVYNMTMYLNISSWVPPNKVGSEWVAVNDTGFPAPGVFDLDPDANNGWAWIDTPAPPADHEYDEQFSTGVTINVGNCKNLWLELELLMHGAAASDFTVESEVCGC